MTRSYPLLCLCRSTRYRPMVIPVEDLPRSQTDVPDAMRHPDRVGLKYTIDDDPADDIRVTDARDGVGGLKATAVDGTGTAPTPRSEVGMTACLTRPHRLY